MAGGIVIRADASPSIGSGHVMRCLTLAEALKGARITFACAEITDSLAARVRAAGHCLVRVDGPAGGPEDLAATCRLAAPADCVVVDGYRFAETWRDGLRSAARRIAVLDDLADTRLWADVVVNPSPLAHTMPYDKVAPGARLLLGPAYSLISSRLLAHRTAPAGADGTLVVSFGGSDPAGLTVPVVEELRRRLPDAPILAIIGGSVPGGEAVAEQVRALGAQAERDVADMGRPLRGCRLAVSAAGSTLYEVMALGRPCLLVIVADNQEPGAEYAGRNGWAWCVDGRRAEAAALIGERAAALWNDGGELERLARVAGGLVDGEGAARVAAAIT